ncbi:MAG: histidine kinase [Candidatus Gottesmanbacteria bacterium GW2011_GWB1_43_11]|uniref:Histidine kinase n=1 Tax=Candidatus Gottesmanbacteria bacterium GW2011_GWB1_43_11 TaxID=1618446 RepID=A0A0G1CJH5_9BACT|nr:MAG: histidine kinase [Candidatus Gottesmanbacteria bacterium GW2011_GWA2_42_16]KKS53003.1 MAG: histidine kinase [Candidatus Gottesmanbacteria bacterium GW2011_GWA1_42_26]KKS80836.1 MAG: histidine kinase [Candidatus Gottesmanbacteria bacterium GW2011_GWC1_43_10]KKS85639.1 MAG: histidine kinase [Candidatus Gottesmanbacteria bacterium GW2011_GWB1_43_11]OGG10645.1 MAG: hypothetical protein A2699_00260 [Candidatus Gottesmanbacteria bacterium RIFCSPHIGHO2_01_FULL_43_15]OGG27858.1 MAG: hypothetic
MDITHKPKVLLVEDNDVYRKVIKNAMVLSGFDALEAENGLRGLEIARLEKPDLILADVYMPVMDGMMMLSELKKDEELLKIPVVMLTNIQEELDNAIKAGAEEAILKSSLTPHQVIDVCRKHLPQVQTENPPVETPA